MKIKEDLSHKERSSKPINESQPYTTIKTTRSTQTKVHINPPVLKL